MWEVSWRLNKDSNILTPLTLLAITAFLSRSPDLLNKGPGGPASAGTWFSFQHLLSNSLELWTQTDLNFLSPGLYNNFTSTYFLRTSQFARNSTPIQSRSPSDIFDRMHLYIYTGAFLLLTAWPGSVCNTRNVVVNVLDCESVVSKFELPSLYKVHFCIYSWKMCDLLFTLLWVKTVPLLVFYKERFGIE